MPDRTVLITGCSSGIGRETALKFGKKGWKVYATARYPEDIENLADKGFETLELDVTDEKQVTDAVETVVENDGRFDCLVNNAGYGQMGVVEDVTTDELHYQFDVNVYGPHRLTRAVLPQMRDQGWGTIVNMSSIAGRISSPGMGAYAASKHALEALSDSLRAEVDDFGIDVVLIEPGPVNTKFGDNVEGIDHRSRDGDEGDDDVEDEGAYEAIYRGIRSFNESLSSGRSAHPTEVAETIYEAAESDDPKARYSVKWSFRIASLGRYVPSKWRDRFYDKLSGE
ncbi:MAG: SDR family oxidoreductase [Halobacteria archaeon]|nr:SDR family oxidoreductase [Halobacteria archaeon]